MRRNSVSALKTPSDASLRRAKDDFARNARQEFLVDHIPSKIPFVGHEPPGRLTVYYRINGEIVCVSPGGRGGEWERTLQGSTDPGERVWLTFTDEPVTPVHLATYFRAVYRPGDIPITPPAREMCRRERIAARRARARSHRANRHARSALREARKTYRYALREARRIYRDELASECAELLAVDQVVACAVLLVAEQERWRILHRVLRFADPPARLWQRLSLCGVPPIEMLFVSLDYLPKTKFTKRQRRCLAAIGAAGELEGYTDSPEGAAYREKVLTAQARHEPMPLLDIPLEYREGGAREDPRWLRRYHESCLLRKAGARLRIHPLCGRYFFAIPAVRPQCPECAGMMKRFKIIRHAGLQGRRGIHAVRRTAPSVPGASLSRA